MEVGPLTTTPVTRLLGLHLTHTREIHLPLYAFQTSLGAPGVLGGARRLTRRSLISGATLVSETTMTHFDPLTALTERNTFVRTVTHSSAASPTPPTPATQTDPPRPEPHPTSPDSPSHPTNEHF
jgi:hypothetical protein